MSSAMGPTDFTGLISSLTEGMRKYLPESSDKGRVVFESSALLQVSYATLNNVPYALLAKEFGMNDLCHMLSSRVTYLEATTMCLVSTIHNLFFAILYSFLAVMTLGLSRNLNMRCKIHWMHVTYGGISTGIAACGVVSPYHGTGLNIMFLLSTMRTLNRCYQTDVARFERPLVEYIQQMAKEQSAVVYNFTRAKVQNDWKYENTYKPSLEHIEAKIHSAKRMDDLTDLAIAIFRQWPRVGVLTSSIEDNQPTNLGSPAAHHHYNNV